MFPDKYTSNTKRNETGVVELPNTPFHICLLEYAIYQDGLYRLDTMLDFILKLIDIERSFQTNI